MSSNELLERIFWALECGQHPTVFRQFKHWALQGNEHSWCASQSAFDDLGIKGKVKPEGLQN
jgi:hypothetical protein